ncbi:MAG: hypothetical protein RIQ96_490 [Pseudomonadota bacterium]|jgi:hypothetical protein
MTMQMTINTNLDEVRRRLSGLEKQVNFAASKALNDTAREVRKAQRKATELDKIAERRRTC